MQPTWKSDCGRVELYLGDCLEVLPNLSPVHSIVTDPPYGLSFMGKRWDYDVPSIAIWENCLRALKPGGHLLAFAGTRTQHRMACRIEDAGFEIRDLLAWVYAQGFPKSHNLEGDWEGWGTALKPSFEPGTLARKPLTGTVAENVLEHGTGAINVDGCRVGDEGGCRHTKGAGGYDAGTVNALGGHLNSARSPSVAGLGRWPANLLHDGSEEVVEAFSTSEKISAARFFYCAKASREDRNEGCDMLPIKRPTDGRSSGLSSGMEEKAMAEQRNHHPTVKPTDLMRYLCRLLTPPDGIVLDPFMGSGSTGKAAALEGFRFVGIERSEEYMEIAIARIKAALNQPKPEPHPELF